MNINVVGGRHRQTGLTMIELMIAMVIGLFLTVAILQVFVGSRVTYSTQAALAHLQENGRFSTEYLSRDIREAGYQGCSVNNTVGNTVIDDGSDLYDFIDFTDALEGLNNVSGSLNYGGKSPIAGTDVIIVKYADSGDSCTVESHNPTSATLKCEETHNFQKGEVLIVSDCSHTGIFQQSNVNNNSTVNTVVHNTGQATPGNCTKGLGLPIPSPCDSTTSDTNGTEYTFPPGASVMGFKSYRYFIANNDFGEPSLYRQGIAATSAVLGYDAAVELVEGVGDLQILYGVDSDNDKVPDKYVDGDEAAGDFEDVTAVRISMLIQSNEENVVKGDQTLTFNGGTQTFSDGRLRKVFTTTIAVRNRI